VTNQNLEQWTAALTAAAAGGLRVESCPEHRGCACVVYADIKHHVPWEGTDPVALAENLLAGKPPVPSPKAERSDHRPEE
jgi:hypothetical protein